LKLRKKEERILKKGIDVGTDIARHQNS